MIAFGPTAGGGTPVTITGYSFDALSGSVTFGGAPVNSIVSWNQTKVVVIIPPGQGPNVPIVLTAVTGLFTTSTAFSYNSPSLLTIAPALGNTAGGTLITLTGSNFVSIDIYI